MKIFRTNDTPQRIACGLGIGVFLGIMPGLGALAALIIASLLRVNKAAAILGALLTNTWTSLLTIFLSIKIGAVIMSLNWRDLYNQWYFLIKNFHWKALFQPTFLKIIFPVLIGYLVIAIVLGLVAHLITILILFLKAERLKR
ncbi:MAG: DUF2062 domain-containing protein [Candidatus Omnitrophota bacterium]